MQFYLGTDEPSWLWNDPPPHRLFISRRRLQRLKRFKPAQTRWALDSGGFTELNMFGEWRTTPHRYVALVQRYINEIGMLDWAAPQDWMCEPFVLKKTGKTITEHQRLTVDNYLDLKTLSPQLPIIPALQGWQPDDYLRHADMYEKAGINLTQVPTVGMGTFCRRGNLQSVQHLVYDLHRQGLNMHAFGVKQDGLPIMGDFLQSADSLAWSFTARYADRRLCGEHHRSPKCTHCKKWATTWANNVINNIGKSHLQMQLTLAP